MVVIPECGVLATTVNKSYIVHHLKNGNVLYFSTKNYSVAKKFRLDTPSKVIRVSPDNRRLGIIATDNIVKIFDVTPNSCTQIFHKENCWFLRWSQTSSYFIFACKDFFCEGVINELSESAPVKSLPKARTQEDPEQSGQPLRKLQSLQTAPKVSHKKARKVEVHDLVTCSKYVVGYEIPSVLMVDLGEIDDDEVFLDKQLSRLSSHIKVYVKGLLKDLSEETFQSKEDDKENISSDNSKTPKFDVVVRKEACSTDTRSTTAPTSSVSESSNKRSNLESLCAVLERENIKELSLFAGESLLGDSQLEAAKRVFQIAKAYTHLKFIQSLGQRRLSPTLQKAEILLFLGDTPSLEDHLISSNRPDVLVSLLLRARQWQTALRHMSFMDTAQKEVVIAKCVQLALKRDDRATLQSLIWKLSDPALQMQVARQLRDKSIFLRLRSTLGAETFQTQIRECLRDLGHSSKAVDGLDSTGPGEPSRGELTRPQTNAIFKSLREIIKQRFLGPPKRGFMHPAAIKMTLAYIGFLKSSHEGSFSAKFRSNMISKIGESLPGDGAVLLAAQKHLQSIFEDPFLAAFPAQLFASSLKALRARDFRKALRFGMLLKIHNQLIPEEQLLLLWMSISVGLEDHEESISLLTRLKDMAEARQDWESLARYNGISKNGEFVGRGEVRKLGYSRKVMQELGLSVPREVCLSSGVLAQDKEKVICRTCRFMTLREEILKKKLGCCGLCGTSFE